MRSPPRPSMTAACHVSAKTPSSSLSGTWGIRKPSIEERHHEHEYGEREKHDAHPGQDEPERVEHRRAGQLTMTASGSPASTVCPAATLSDLRVPATGATIGSSIFKASIIR